MGHQHINRRSFLKGIFMTAGAAALAQYAPKSVSASTQSNPITGKGRTARLNPRSASIASALPRNETLYFNGQQWETINGWNPYSPNMNNSMVIAQGDNARVTMFETPYLYNMLDGKQYPLLADGSWSWNAQMTQITFKIKSAARWSDGTPVTAEDVAYTWATNAKYEFPAGNMYKDYITSIVAADAQTVQVNAVLDGGGKAKNPLMVAGYLSYAYVIQKAWTIKLEARTNGNGDLFAADPAEDVVYSGPYHKFSADDSAVVLIRNDNYWGKHATMWGKLPAPKYLAHVLYPDNDAALNALKTGETDVSQLFIAGVQDLWGKELLPISTYMKNAPYGICASLPTAYYNLSAYGLDQVTIRKAIAIAVDYSTIIANAISNQSPTFAQAPRSLMNPTPGEQALYDHTQVQHLQWVGNDIAAAKKLLDDAGIKDTDGDGWREYNGKMLEYVATCPDGWSDWQAAIENVAAAGKTIGIKITTNYPSWAEYQTKVTNWPLPTTGYDIVMFWSDGAGPAEPWARVEKLMHSKYAKTKNNWNGNLGGYENSVADALINALPAETDPATIKQAYTDLTKIYLTDIPSFTLMYRPQSFQTVNESVWTDFPHEGDGTNPPVPPLDLTDGWSIAGLYNLTLKPQKPDLSTSTLTVDHSMVNGDQEILTYSLVVNNTGGAGADAKLDNPLPGKITYVANSGFANDGNPVTFENGSLSWSGTVASGSAVRIQYLATTHDLQSVGELITNIASISDGFGKTIQCQAQSIYNPGWGMSVDDGALATNINKVGLNYHWDTDVKVTQMQISNDGGFGPNGNTTGWLEAESTNHTYLGWEIKSLANVIIPRTVYIRFRDANHKIYGPFSDDIIYDSSVPTISDVNIIQATGLGTANMSMSNQVIVRVSFSDDNSGVGVVRVSNQPGFENASEFPVPAAGQKTLDIPWSLQSSGDVYVKVVDQAGNESVVHDKSGPVNFIYLPMTRR